MTLNRDDFPGLTDEQWTAIQAENDRRATEASKTAIKNAAKDAENAQAAAIAAAVEAERAKLEADEQGKLEIRRKELEAQEAKLAADRKSLAATKKLVAAGYSEDAIEGMLPMFTTVDDSVFEATIDSFVKFNQGLVKSQVDAAKVELLNNATPPANPTGNPVDVTTAATELLNKGEDVAAVDMILTDAYGAPPQ